MAGDAARRIFGCEVAVESSPSPQSSSFSFSPGRAPMNSTGDVPIRLLAREADHVVREVDDLHGLAHVEHEHVPARPSAPAWTIELDGLRDRHEVALHLRMGDGHRPAARDLAAEERDDASRRAEHVAEADGDEAGPVPVAGRCGRDDPLADRLRLAEDVLRPHGLVRGDEDEALRRRCSAASSASTFVPRTLFRTDSSGLASMRGTCLYAAAWKTTAGRWRSKSRRIFAASFTSASAGTVERYRALVLELAVDLDERVLGVVDEHDLLRSERGDLAAELRADGAAGAGHEDGRARDVRGDRRNVELDCLAAEDVLHLDLAELARRLRSPVISSWTPGRVLTGTPASRQALTTFWRTSPAPDGMAMMTSSGRFSDEEPRQLVGGPQHAHPVEAHVPLARVVVDESDRGVAEARRLQHLANDQLARVAGADDERLLAARHETSPPGPLDHRPREEPRPRDEREGEEPVDCDDPSRDAQSCDRVATGR